MKRRNPRFGYPCIALIISRTFGIEIDRNAVRRVLAKHYSPDAGGGGPSWLIFIGHMKDSLWSVDLFRCESIILKTHWVLVVMDQFTRRIIGFAVHVGDVDGSALCRMFNRVISAQALPRYLSTDHDPLFEFHRWKANLRVLDVDELETVPYTLTSHPFVERLIGAIRREFLDHVLFWNTLDLEKKLSEFRHYYNQERVHASPPARLLPKPQANLQEAKPGSIISVGSRIAGGSFSFPWQPDRQFDTHTHSALSAEGIGRSNTPAANPYARR